MSDAPRNFTIESSNTGKTGGVFTGRKPRDAAMKAARRIFSESPRKRVITFTIRERGTETKSTYKATMAKLSTPREFVRGGITIQVTKGIELEFVGRAYT